MESKVVYVTARASEGGKRVKSDGERFGASGVNPNFRDFRHSRWPALHRAALCWSFTIKQLSMDGAAC